MLGGLPLLSEIPVNQPVIIIPAVPGTNAIRVKISTDHVSTPSLEDCGFDIEKKVTQIIIIDRYIPIMNNSDWAKLHSEPCRSALINSDS